MKKMAVFFMPFFMVMLLHAAGTARAAGVPGDVNGDLKVSPNDVIQTLRSVVGLITLNAAQSDGADLSPQPGAGPKAGQKCGDGVIDIFDAIEVMKEMLAPSLPIEPTFANVQRVVFNQSCAFSSCHSAKSNRGGLVLEEGASYEKLVNVKVSIDGDVPDARIRVAPGDPEHSFLLTKLEHPGPNDGERMPQGTESGLAPSKIELIREWIKRGAPKDGDFTPLPEPDNQQIPIDPNFDDIGDVQLDPPPMGQGVQIVIPPFEVPLGKEIQRNYYYKIPVDVDVDIQKVEFAFNPGSHHLNVFKSDTEDWPEGFFRETFSAVDWQSEYLVVDSQSSSLGWKLPEGVSIHLKARQQMNFQIHYVNVGDQRTRNGRGKAIINFWFSKPGTVKAHMGALFAQNRKILLPPEAFSTFTKTVKFPQDATVLAITGHYHSRGKQFIVNKWDGQTVVDQEGLNAGEEVYRNIAWADPPFKIYEQPFGIKAGEGLSYTSTYYNNTDKPMEFGAQVDINEHSNLFVFFYPAPPDDKAIYDF